MNTFVRKALSAEAT